MKEEKVNELIVTFADYVEIYYDRDCNSGDVPNIVNEHFDEFIDWAYDDHLIEEAEQEILKGKTDPEFRNSLKKEVVQEFVMILRVKKYLATV